MGMYNELDFFTTQFKIEDCFQFLSCSDVDVDEIRKKFYFKLFCLYRYNKVIESHYEKAISSNSLYMEQHKTHLLMRLVSDCYLAILLYKSNDSKNYEHIINSLASFFYLNHSKNKNILTESLESNSKEKNFETADIYLEALTIINNGGTREGLYRYTSSLMNIMLLEKELLSQKSPVKVLTYKNELKYGDIDTCYL